ncbi:hypothetical protein [Burkholderia pseudomallei]|uniref:Uncharacterized protein n=2 Tax=Burkholderiaceae TaxID=119060 RepID=A0AAX0U0A5_BURPE|nr:hypothetical protein [Burkholderia pseudomallei]PJO61946.1 hypothetical protein CWD88_33660 [Burkholderia pseudomallei]
MTSRILKSSIFIVGLPNRKGKKTERLFACVSGGRIRREALERKESIMPKALKPGTAAPSSGLYRNNVTRNEVTGVKGRPLPPTPGRHQTDTLVDPAKHKR